jgi:hypothetical protein
MKTVKHRQQHYLFLFFSLFGQLLHFLVSYVYNYP